MPNRHHPRQEMLHRFFWIGLALKGLHGALETIAGVALLFVSPGTVRILVCTLTRHELAEDPGDIVANYLSRAARYFSLDTRLFISAYLLIHGAVKIFLVVEVLRKKPWAYPATIAVLIAFIVYQIYRLSFDHSIEMVVLTIFDLLVLLLVWREYNHVRTRPT